MSLRAEYALVTGGSRGIGRGIALKLAAEGVKVGVHYYRNEKAAKETLTGVRQSGSDGVVVQADVTQADEVSRLFDQIRKHFGQLDIFVSNARPEAPEFFAPPSRSPWINGTRRFSPKPPRSWSAPGKRRNSCAMVGA